MAKTKINHLKRARRAWPHLVKVANHPKNDFITYGDLSAKIGLHPRAASWFLGEIQRFCKRKGYPPLQALAVYQRTKRPGGGYIASARNGPDYDKAVRRVKRFNWPPKAPF